MVIWHDNGDHSNFGYTEEVTGLIPDEVRAEYEAHGCRVFSIDVQRGS